MSVLPHCSTTLSHRKLGSLCARTCSPACEVCFREYHLFSLLGDGNSFLEVSVEALTYFQPERHALHECPIWNNDLLSQGIMSPPIVNVGLANHSSPNRNLEIYIQKEGGKLINKETLKECYTHSCPIRNTLLPFSQKV